METHKIIAVYGNSGSYKTTTAAAVARRVAEVDSDADVLLVGLDSTKPLLPLIFPNDKGKNTANRSLGKLLANEFFDCDTIVAQAVLSGKIGVLGYNACENINSYAFPTDARIDDFYLQLRQLANYTIIDCTADVLANKLTAKALIAADDVLWTVSCDLNGLIFVQSQEPLLRGHQYSYANYIRALTLGGKFPQDEAGMRNAVTKIAAAIPFSPKTAENWNSGNALDKTSDKAYEREINAIAERFIDYEENEGDYDFEETQT